MKAEEVASNIFRLEIPLPANPLKALNSYVIKGDERHLIIDCGMRREECRDAMRLGLDELRVDLEKTDFFITHFHADHLGLVSDLATPRSAIYLNRPDAVRIMDRQLRDAFERSARLHGFPEEQIDRALEMHPGSRYGVQRPLTFVMPEDGQEIEAGGYRFACVATPGHSFGHLCLYEQERKILIAGDHILGDITPNIQCWFDDWNPLKEYLESLDKTARLDVDLVLPGHRRLFTDMRARIEELKEHHARRVEEVVAILKEGARTAYGLASAMTWDIICDTFELFPLSQKWFATGEAIAHLIYLEGLGRVRRERNGEGPFFWKIREE